MTYKRGSKLHELWKYHRDDAGCYKYHILVRHIFPDSSQREYEVLQKYSPLAFTHRDMPAINRRLTGPMGNSVEGNIPSGKRHDEIRVLALGKLNTISDRVSTALVDGEIYNHEFCLVLDEVEKYHKMKDQIDAHAAVVENEETKTPLSDGAVRPS